MKAAGVLTKTALKMNVYLFYPFVYMFCLFFLSDCICFIDPLSGFDWARLGWWMDGMHISTALL